MRIAFLLYDLDMGGMVTWVYNLATRLHRDHELHFICTHVDRIAPKFFQVGQPVFLGQDWRRLVRYLRDRRIDIVQFGQTRRYADCALAAGVPVVIERADGPRRPPVMPKTDFDAVIVSTQVTWPEATRAAKPGKTHLLYNGVDVAQFDSIAPDRLGYESSDVLIGQVTRFGHGKNIELLIDAVRILKDSYPSIRLILVGANSKMRGAADYESVLRARAAGLDPWIRFIGQVDDPKAIIAGFNIAVSSSRSEGVPNSLMECMAAGKPVVASEVGGIPELITHGDEGLLFKDNNLMQLTDALNELLRQPSLREQMGARARLRVQRDFNLDMQVTKYLALYHTLLEDRRQATWRQRLVRVAARNAARVSLIARPYRESIARAVRGTPAAQRGPRSPGTRLTDHDG